MGSVTESELFMVNRFSLERVKERFGYSIVVATQAVALENEDRLRGQQFSVHRARVLAATVAVHDQRQSQWVSSNRPLECGADQLSIDPRAGRPADDSPREEIQDHGQIQPPFGCPDVCNI